MFRVLGLEFGVLGFGCGVTTLRFRAAESEQVENMAYDFVLEHCPRHQSLVM